VSRSGSHVLGYSRRFFSVRSDGSSRSAERILPSVLAMTRAASLLDVGCGSGTWASTALRLGAADVIGVDGDWIAEEDLQLEPERFVRHDLTRPLDLGRTFDLVVCLEVAEHLPADAADELLASLVRHAPAVLFSAAIPYQGGRNHVNEQWQSHWIARFDALGLGVHDVVRPAVWSDPAVEPWYAQNAFLFVERSHAEHLEIPPGVALPPDLVHPAMHTLRNAQPALRPALRLLPRAIRSDSRRLRGAARELVRRGGL
jgi:SAM-dependent methyltransferase